MSTRRIVVVAMLVGMVALIPMVPLAQMGPGAQSGMGPGSGSMMQMQGMMGGSMMGQLSDDQLKAMAQRHGMTPEQVKQMGEQCQSMMGSAGAAPDEKKP